MTQDLKQNEDEVLGLKVWTICGMWPIITIGNMDLSKTLVKITGWNNPISNPQFSVLIDLVHY